MRNSKIFKTFLQGLLFVLPILLTITIVTWLVTGAESLLAEPLKLIVPDPIQFPGMGILAALIAIYFLGLLIQGKILDFLIYPLLNLLNRIPLVNVVYQNIKEMVDFISGAKDDELERVVLVSMPNGLKLMGFVTNTDSSITVSNSSKGDKEGDKDGDKTIAVFLPMSYQMGGYLVYAPESEVETLDISKQEAMQRILTAEISGSKFSPKK
jgi:uncharacterized membrane protein